MRRVLQKCVGAPVRAAGLAGLALCVLSGSALGVQVQGVVVADFAQAGGQIPGEWELSENKGKADLALVPDGDGEALRLRSRSSSYSLQKSVEIDLKKTPFLQWQWKVTELPQGGDFRKEDTNDQAAQLLVVFSWGTFKKEVVAYIWDSTAPKGTTGKDPSSSYVPFLTVHTVVVESGNTESGRWVTMTRNVAEDYKRLFGHAPDKVVGIRLQINSQHTKSRAESYWRSLTFKAFP